MDCEVEFRRLVHKIAEGLTAENVNMMRYLCRDAIQHSMEFKDALSFFEYFESKGWISFSDMSFLAEVLYRINRHDLLKRLPNVKNRREYELNFLNLHTTQNFTPFRIACFQLIDELTISDFKTLKNFCRNKLSKRNYERSIDVISLLVCLEEEDYISDGDLSFLLDCLCHLDNQTPYNTFYRLSQGDSTFVLPKIHQTVYHKSQSIPVGSRSLLNCSYKSDGHFDHTSDYQLHHASNLNENLLSPYMGDQTRAKFFFGPPQKQQQQFLGNDESRTFSEDQGYRKPYFQSEHQSDAVQKTPIEHDTTQPSPVADTSMQHSIHENVVTQTVQQSSMYPKNNGSSDQSLGKSQTYSQPTYVLLPEKPTEPEMDQIIDKASQCLYLEDYPMTQKPIGICVVINNYNFEGHSANLSGVQLGNRKGSEIDCKKISSLFDCFGFDVKVYEDLNVKYMKEVLKGVAKASHEMHDCFVLVIMSHGGKGCIYGVDNNVLYLAEIKTYFKPDYCPTLVDKPKIFFIQACQTDVSNVPVESNAPSADLELDGSSFTPPEADFLICYSTVPGYPSYRSRSFGSFFIKLLVESLVQYSKSHDLLSIMTQVNNQIAKQELGQIAMPISTLRRKINLSLCKPFPDNLLSK